MHTQKWKQFIRSQMKTHDLNLERHNIATMLPGTLNTHTWFNPSCSSKKPYWDEHDMYITKYIYYDIIAYNKVYVFWYLKKKKVIQDLLNYTKINHRHISKMHYFQILYVLEKKKYISLNKTDNLFTSS